jgi:hypothetical protein
VPKGWNYKYCDSETFCNYIRQLSGIGKYTSGKIFRAVKECVKTVSGSLIEERDKRIILN